MLKIICGFKKYVICEEVINCEILFLGFNWLIVYRVIEGF